MLAFAPFFIIPPRRATPPSCNWVLALRLAPELPAIILDAALNFAELSKLGGEGLAEARPRPPPWRLCQSESLALAAFNNCSVCSSAFGVSLYATGLCCCGSGTGSKSNELCLMGEIESGQAGFTEVNSTCPPDCAFIVFGRPPK